MVNGLSSDENKVPVPQLWENRGYRCFPTDAGVLQGRLSQVMINWWQYFIFYQFLLTPFIPTFSPWLALKKSQVTRSSAHLFSHPPDPASLTPCFLVTHSVITIHKITQINLEKTLFSGNEKFTDIKIISSTDLWILAIFCSCLQQLKNSLHNSQCRVTPILPTVTKTIFLDPKTHFLESSPLLQVWSPKSRVESLESFQFFKFIWREDTFKLWFAIAWITWK